MGNRRLALAGQSPAGGHDPAAGVPDVLKPRDERLKVLIRARMRIGASWADVCIVNITPGGLGMQAARPPKHGDYVEIQRGAHVIVGRVIWSGTHRFGVRAQGTLPVDSIMNDPDRQLVGAAAAERPAAAPRPRAHQLESRIRVRLFEFLCIAGVGVGFALAVAGSVQAAIAAPMAQIATALGKH